ncbi:hypothetical protein F2P81_015797 [Scophthalmus maximus]|uniref:Uncharacterized protein n=1 Tax=Scophthalmus maximus TaxID=52904 RepID=A0A6A4SLP9_SCOMX|nr:hypothetical protein F2P81_015797 [Scophthalmus maximus]
MTKGEDADRDVGCDDDVEEDDNDFADENVDEEEEDDESQTLTRRTMHNSKERKKNRTLIALIDVQTLAVWMPPTVVLTPRLSVGPGGYLLAATCASCGLGASRCQISFYTADSTRSSDSNPRPGRPRSRLAVHTHPQSAVVLPPLTSCQGGIALHGGPSPSPVHTQTQSH